MKPILFSFFLLFSFPAVTEGKVASGASPLYRTLAEGNIHAFRIEIDKLLNDPVPDFFKSIVAYVTGEFYLDQHIRNISARHLSTEAVIQFITRFAFDNFILDTALSLPLGKKDKNDLMAKDVALLSENWPVHAVLKEYDNNVTRELYDGGKASVWTVANDGFPIDTNLEDVPWKRLPKVNLSHTPSVKALIGGDIKAFQRAWETLLAGPARELFPLLHSRGEDGKTFFHYAAAFRPMHLQEINDEDLTPGQKEEMTLSRTIIANSLRELLELFPPDVKGFERYISREALAKGKVFSLLSKWKRSYAVIGATGVIAGLTAASSRDEFIGLFAGLASGIAIEGALRCYDKFKSKSGSKK